jgi:ABC-type Fe3+/spermidine/putrescine transport system ATPase subunit
MIYGDIIALDDVSLHVEDKEYVCIIGPSGCGKSTLIKCIAGILQPTKGEILIDGRSMKSIQIEDRRVGYVFQEIALFPHLSVRENLSYGLAVRKAEPGTINTVTNEMLDLINMRDRSKSYPKELSGGAQQTVAVARAIATGSHLFLLDEPLGALDSLVRVELRYELRKLANDLGLTVIHVTHDQEEALSIADRVVVMKRGRIVEVGRPTEVYHSPQNLFTQNFVGETNLFEASVLSIDDSACCVKIGKHRVLAHADGTRVGQKVVAAIRPEFVKFDNSPDGWNCQIKEVSLLGGVTRYAAEDSEGLEIVAHVPSSAAARLAVGDNVILSMSHNEHMLLYDYPVDGIEKEVALE